MFEEETITLIDGIDEVWNVQIRTITRVLKDGEIFGAETYHRHVLAMGDDLTDEPAHIQQIVTAVWGVAATM